MTEQRSALITEIDALKQQLGAKQDELATLDNRESAEQRVEEHEAAPGQHNT